MRFRWMRTCYEVVLFAYPIAFRRRFGPAMREDFARLLHERGRWHTWLRIGHDLVCSIPDAHARARATRVAERARAIPREALMSALMFDLRHAVRLLLKVPVFTGVTVVTLALGIGANSATFSLVNAALLRPLGFGDADRLVLIYEGIPQSSMATLPASPPDFVDLRSYQRSFSAVAAFHAETMELSGSGTPERIAITRANADVFPLLGVRPILGRTFSAAEDTPGHDVVVLSYALWQRLFAGNPAVLGASIRLDRRPFTVLGVMPASFEFPRRGPTFNGTPADAWIPRAFGPEELTAVARGTSFNNSVIAKLKPGVTLEQARAELSMLGPRIRENYPVQIRSSGFQLAMTAVPFREEIAGQIRAPLLILFAAVMLVLLVACANVANLILSRAAVRRREIGVRQALGGTRRRLLQLLLCESVLLCAAGGLLGLLAGRLVLAAVPAALTIGLPGLYDVSLDVRVVAFTLATSMLTAIIFGLIPLFESDRDVVSRLHEASGRTIGARGQRVQRVLVSVTVALAVVLLVGAGLLVRSFNALVRTEPGFRPERVLTMSVDLPRAAYPSGASVAAFVRRAYQQVRTLPGVSAATLSTAVPLESNERRAATARGSASDKMRPAVAVTWTFGDYFKTLGVPIRSGRVFTSEEDDVLRPVAIVSESLSRHYWPGEDAIGKQIKWGSEASLTPWMTVVGVVGDVKDGSLRDEPTLHVYVPFSEIVAVLDVLPPASGFGRELRFALLGTTDPTTLVPLGRRAIAAVDRALPVTRIATMQQLVEDSMSPQRFSTLVLVAFAGGALMLAAVGLYGVLAFAVAQRTREIGVRMALGASQRTVLAMIVRQGLVLVAIGLGLGLLAASAVTRVMDTLLYQTAPHDPWTFAAVPVMMLAVSLLACYVPGRRAASVNPMSALRTE
jgi:predicted permease